MLLVLCLINTPLSSVPHLFLLSDVPAGTGMYNFDLKEHILEMLVKFNLISIGPVFQVVFFL